MTWLVLIGLMVVSFVLWQRVNSLENEIESLRDLGLGQAPRRPERASERAFEAEQAAARAAPPAPEQEPVAPPPPPPPPLPRPVPHSAIPAPVVVTRLEETPEEMAEEPAHRTLGFEDIFGRYLPIWAGGVTLAVAGFLIVKYSIDAGLLSPTIRVILGLIFGTGLIAGAEVALRSHKLVGDDRIRQSLAGAGIATLYASILVAANLYHLIDPMTAFIGLAVVTLLAAALSLRFGAPSAVLGLVGGLAAPALVGAESPNVPLLATYLAFTVGGLCALGRSQRWWWLGALAVAGGFGWGALLILGGLDDMASILAVGTLTLLFATAFPILLLGDRGVTLRFAAALMGCAQMAAIVATGGFAPLEWGMFGLFSAAIVFLSRRQSLLAGAPLAGLTIGVLLTLAWPAPTPTMLALVLAGGLLIYGGPALWKLWRSDGAIGDALQVAGGALAVALVPLLHFEGQYTWPSFSALALAGAAIAGFAAALGWRHPDRLTDSRFALLSVSAIGMALLAAIIGMPEWPMAPVTAIAALATLLLGKRSGDDRVELSAHAFGVAALFFLIEPNGAAELLHATGEIEMIDATARGFIRWLVPAAALLAFARWSSMKDLRIGFEGGAALMFYVAAAQLVPSPWLALLPATAIAAIALLGGRERTPLGALAALGALSLAWAAEPLLSWLARASGSLAGFGLYVTDLPPLDGVAIRIAAPGIALALLLWRKALPERVREIGTIQLAALATITVHIVWKHVFAIADADAFAAYGMAERTLWEALLAAAAIGAWRLGSRRIATGLGVASLAHFAWFSMGIHNPLWDAQAMGPWLIPAYGVAFGLVWLSRYPAPGAVADRVRGGAQMALILMFALSALSQIFHGSWLTLWGVTQAEDIARSLLAIALAIGFLQWGIRKGERDWRITSLVLMLGAVGKVFLFDAAGLDGLLRIASFAALGFSLIGVGWLYSRYLPDSRLAPKED